MSKVVVINHVTLDGVMQAPGRPEQDTRDGFTHGGWSIANVDDQLLAATQSRVAEGGELQLLLGRRSYEGMLGYWNRQDSPFKDGLNNAPKYVASRTLREPLPWPNSTLLAGDVANAVTELKHGLTGDLSPPDAIAQRSRSGTGGRGVGWIPDQNESPPPTDPLLSTAWLLDRPLVREASGERLPHRARDADARLIPTGGGCRIDVSAETSRGGSREPAR